MYRRWRSTRVYSPSWASKGLRVFTKLTKWLSFVSPRSQPCAEKPVLGLVTGAGSKKAHKTLHTRYQVSRRIRGELISLEEGDRLNMKLCVGTFCYQKDSYDTPRLLSQKLEEENLTQRITMEAVFCFEECSVGPSAKIGNQLLVGQI